MPRDRLRAFFEVIARGNPTEVREEGDRFKAEIDKDMRKLRSDRRMIGDLLARYGGAVDRMTPPQRSAKVREAALALVKTGKDEINTQDVLTYLEEHGTEFTVKRPASMVGTVLFQASDLFERLGQNQFRYRGPQPPSDSAGREAGRGSDAAGDDDEGGED